MRKNQPSSGILLILALIMGVSFISKEIRDLGIINADEAGRRDN